MSDKTKVKVEFASALVRQLWIAGLITKAEQNAMAERSKQELLKANNESFLFPDLGWIFRRSSGIFAPASKVGAKNYG